VLGPVDDLQLAEKTFLEAEYAAILAELKAGRSRSQIVGRMVQEGYDIPDALALYDQFAENREKIEEVVRQLRREIDEARFRQQEQYALTRPLPAPINNDAWLHQREEEKKAREAMGHLALHILPHLILKIFGIRI
jgi:hypothetical protein